MTRVCDVSCLPTPTLTCLKSSRIVEAHRMQASFCSAPCVCPSNSTLSRASGSAGRSMPAAPRTQESNKWLILCREGASTCLRNAGELSSFGTVAILSLLLPLLNMRGPRRPPRMARPSLSVPPFFFFRALSLSLSLLPFLLFYSQHSSPQSSSRRRRHFVI